MGFWDPEGLRPEVSVVGRKHKVDLAPSQDIYLGYLVYI